MIMQLQGIIMCGLVRRLIGRAVCVRAAAAGHEGIRLRDVSVHLAVRFDAVFNRESAPAAILCGPLNRAGTCGDRSLHLGPRVPG